MISGLLLGCASLPAHAEGALAPVEAKEAHLSSFGAAELEKQRAMFKTFLAKVDDTMTVKLFEDILGDKMILYKSKSPTGSGKFVDLYYANYQYDNYKYSFGYSDEKSGENTGFGISSNFEISDERLSDRENCLTLENIKAFAEAGGWKVDGPFADWTRHGFTATKQRLQLRAVARGGVGEWPLPGEDKAKIADSLAFKGCVLRLTVDKLIRN
jgi:hypothetical protein